MEDDKVEPTYTVPSVSSGFSPSPSPPFNKSDDSDSESDSSDSDSDVEPFDLNNDATDAPLMDTVLIYNDAPFMPPRQQSPSITTPFETALPPKLASRKTPTPPRVASLLSQRSRQRKRGRPSSDEDSDHDADCESTGDASDDEYVPSPSFNPRKRARSASPVSSQRTSASPPASVSSSDHPNKRARLPPPSRNRQATTAEIQRVENSDDFNDFVCRVCGWVQKNERLPDFKRHVKTHQRTFDEDAQKGWRCKGVLVSEAAHWGLGADLPTFIFLDNERVGGCMKTFSRRDALKRHLDNGNVSCVGYPSAPTEE